MVKDERVTSVGCIADGATMTITVDGKTLQDGDTIEFETGVMGGAVHLNGVSIDHDRVRVHINTGNPLHPMNADAWDDGGVVAWLEGDE